MIENPEIILIPERKSTGAMIVDMLLILLPQAGIDPFKRIFNTIVNEGRMNRKAEENYQAILSNMSQRESNFYTERKTSFGFSTDKQKRDLLYGNILQNAARQSHAVIRDHMLVDEILGLTEKGGRIDHSQLGHDDHVIAWLMCHWLVVVGMNLAHYGIDPGLVMSAVVSEEDKNKTATQLWKDDLQSAYLKEIDELVAKLSDTENDAMAALYENRLRLLSRKVEAAGNIKDFSVDGIFDRVRKEREKKYRLSMVSSYYSEEKAVHDNVMDMIGSLKSGSYRQTASQWYN
jgi:hypothetical protein